MHQIFCFWEFLGAEKYPVWELCCPVGVPHFLMLAITEKLVDGEEGFAGGQVLFCYWTSVLLVYNEHWLILSFFTTCNGQRTCLWPGLGGLRRMPDSHEKWKCAGRIWDGPWSGDLHLLQNLCSIILMGARDTESEWTTWHEKRVGVFQGVRYLLLLLWPKHRYAAEKSNCDCKVYMSLKTSCKTCYLKSNC